MSCLSSEPTPWTRFAMRRPRDTARARGQARRLHPDVAAIAAPRRSGRAVTHSTARADNRRTKTAWTFVRQAIASSAPATTGAPAAAATIAATAGKAIRGRGIPGRRPGENHRGIRPVRGGGPASRAIVHRRGVERRCHSSQRQSAFREQAGHLHRDVQQARVRQTRGRTVDTRRRPRRARKGRREGSRRSCSVRPSARRRVRLVAPPTP